MLSDVIVSMIGYKVKLLVHIFGQLYFCRSKGTVFLKTLDGRIAGNGACIMVQTFFKILLPIFSLKVLAVAEM